MPNISSHRHSGFLDNYLQKSFLEHFFVEKNYSKHICWILVTVGGSEVKGQRNNSVNRSTPSLIG